MGVMVGEKRAVEKGQRGKGRLERDKGEKTLVGIVIDNVTLIFSFFFELNNL